MAPSTVSYRTLTRICPVDPPRGMGGDLQETLVDESQETGVEVTADPGDTLKSHTLGGNGENPEPVKYKVVPPSITPISGVTLKRRGVGVNQSERGCEDRGDNPWVAVEMKRESVAEYGTLGFKEFLIEDNGGMGEQITTDPSEDRDAFNEKGEGKDPSVELLLRVIKHNNSDEVGMDSGRTGGSRVTRGPALCTKLAVKL